MAGFSKTTERTVTDAQPSSATRQILLSGGPFSGSHVTVGAVPHGLLCILIPGDESKVARYRRTPDPDVRVFHDFEDVQRPGASS